MLRSGGQSGVSWVNAQDSCLAEGSNLLEIYSADEYAFIAGKSHRQRHSSCIQKSLRYPNRERGLVSQTQNARESLSHFFTRIASAKSVRQMLLLETSISFHLRENQREKDCVFFAFNVTEGIAYNVADCEELHPYICRKRQGRWP